MNAISDLAWRLAFKHWLFTHYYKSGYYNPYAANHIGFPAWSDAIVWC